MPLVRASLPATICTVRHLFGAWYSILEETIMNPFGKVLLAAGLAASWMGVATAAQAEISAEAADAALVTLKVPNMK